MSHTYSMLFEWSVGCNSSKLNKPSDYENWIPICSNAMGDLSVCLSPQLEGKCSDFQKKKLKFLLQHHMPYRIFFFFFHLEQKWKEQTRWLLWRTLTPTSFWIPLQASTTMPGKIILCPSHTSQISQSQNVILSFCGIAQFLIFVATFQDLCYA